MVPSSQGSRLAWIPDLHFDHLEKRNPLALGRLGDYLDSREVDLLLLGGDISESRSLKMALENTSRMSRRPIAFVLGNHDYYFGSVDSTRHTAAMISDSHLSGDRTISWLPKSGVVNLGGGSGLIGVGGWGDARRGNLSDFVILTDFAAISDLARCVDREDFWTDGFRKRDALVERLNDLGAGAAGELQKILEDAGRQYRDLVVMTHVTPFYETSTYKGGPGYENGFPCFVWEAAREVLIRFAEENPSVHLSVISGHTHDASRAEILPNLHSWSAAAEYGELRCRILSHDGAGHTWKIWEQDLI